MIDEMAELIENFPGAANQTRCFLHILNLTAKSILQQFEVPRKKKTGDNGDDKKTLNKAMNELLVLANEIEDEPSLADDVDEDTEGVGDSEDNGDGFEDERQDLSAEQIAELEADLLPIRLMLTKVWSG